MIGTLFYLYGIVYLGMDIISTIRTFSKRSDSDVDLEKKIVDMQERVLSGDLHSAMESMQEVKQKVEAQSDIGYTALSILNKIWIIVGLQTSYWPHFLFLIILFILETFAPIDKIGSIIDDAKFKFVTVLGTILRISTVGIILYKHFYA